MIKSLYLTFFLIVQISISFAQTPGFEWVHTHGGANEDYGSAITTDNLNNVYSCGSFFWDTVDFDPGPGIANLSSAGSEGFVQKLNANGDFLWVKPIPSGVASIATDASNNIIISGTFIGTVIFSTLSGNDTISSPTTSDNFILKMNSDGDILWVNSFGTPNKTDYMNEIQLDDSGNIYSTGSFYSTCDFDPGAGISNLSSAGGSLDIFVQKLTAAGDYVWAKKIGGGGSDLGKALAVKGNAISLTGWFQNNVDFDPSTAYTIINTVGQEDIYLLSLSTDGNFNWVKNFGSTLGDQGTDVAMTSSGEIYLTGRFEAAIDMDPGTATNIVTADNGTNFFILKLSGAGDLIWARTFTGTGYKIAGAMTVLPNNGVMFTGNFDGVVDFDCGSGVNYLVSNGDADIFTVYLDQNGNYIWAGSYGNTGTNLGDYAACIRADTQGNVYSIGNFAETVDFDCGPGIAERTTAGIFDIFIQKLNSNLLAVNANTLSNFKVYPNPAIDQLSISVENLNNCHVTICNSIGMIVLEKDLSGSDSQLNIQSLSTGSYVVQLTGESGSSHQTFVKTN